MKLLETLSQHILIDEKIHSFLQHQTETRDFKKGEILSRQDYYARTIYFVNSGLARAFYIEKGREYTLNFYPEGKIFANIDTIFTNKPTRYNFETLERSTITFCNYEKLEELCSASLTAANFSRYILGILMTQMGNRIASLQYLSAKEKYTQLLVENPDIILRVPLGMIAGYLGISQETLSRIRSGL